MNKSFLLATVCAAACLVPSEVSAADTLKDVLGKYFTVGAAVNVDAVWGRNAAEAKIVVVNFYSLLAENWLQGWLLYTTPRLREATL